jgi:two-component system response regulator NreC
MNGAYPFWRNDGERRLTVLVADDSPSMLEMASSVVASDFDVVAAVADGRQALLEALRLDPDVVVLDISMPELDGFQTCRALKGAGSRAKIVMLTMHESDEFVGAAIECGALGYVLKTRMASDLVSAIDHAIDGRVFVPSPASLTAIAPAGARGHAVQFRANDRALFDGPGRLLSAALHRGEVAAIVGTDETRAKVAQRLIAAGHDLDEAASLGKYIARDAATALSQVMADGRLDVGRLAAMVDDLERSRLAGSASQLTIVGEMAPLLCLDANPEAAIQLEGAWADLTQGLPFLTVCRYSMTCFGEGTDPELFRSICAVHGSVCHAYDA